jgi:hypothetical protein
MAHTLYSHGQRGAEMSLTMGTCPVRGGSALIKCADHLRDPSLKCAAASRLVHACSVQTHAAKGSPSREGSEGGARPPDVLSRRHKVGRQGGLKGYIII